MADPIFELSEQTITLTRAQTRIETLSVFADEAQATPVDITGASVTLTVRYTADGPLLLVLDNLNSGITAIGAGANNNEFTYNIDSDETVGWSTQTYVYDIVIKEIPIAGDVYYHIRSSPFVLETSPFGSSNLNVTSVSVSSLVEQVLCSLIAGDNITFEITDTNGNKTLTINSEANLVAKYVTNDLDDVGGGVTYLGQFKPEGSWLVKRITETGDDLAVDYANLSNNPTRITYTDAFTNRLTLTYEEIQNLTGL